MVWRKTKRAKKKRRAAAQYYTEFTDQPLKLYCPGYECTDRGVRDQNGKVVCMHPILPVRALKNIDTEQMRLTVAFNARGLWEEHTLPCEAIASPTGILALAGKGAAVTGANARALSVYLMQLFYHNPVELDPVWSLDRMGWTGRCTDMFVPFENDVVFEGGELFKEKYGAIRPHGDVHKWEEAAVSVWKRDLTARLALDASFASVLLTPLDLQPFFVHIWGRTGLGKTVLLQLAASVWGSISPGRLISSFNATGTGLELTAAFFHDMPMLIDELQIMAAGGKNDFQQLIYTLSEGVGRTRGARDGGLQQTRTWRNIMITTGEMPLSAEKSCGGAMNRSIELELTAPITDDFYTLLQTLAQHHGQAGFMFVQQFTRCRDRLKDIYEGHVKALTERGVSGKQAVAMAALLLADDMVNALFFQRWDVPAVKWDDAAALLKKDEDLCTEARAIRYLFDTIAANPAKFSAERSPYQVNEVWGKPVAEYTAVIGKVFDTIMEQGGFNARAVLAYADRQGLLQTQGDHLKKVVNFGATRTRCVVIKQPDEDRKEM